LILGAKMIYFLKESWFDDGEIKAYREFLSKDAKEINASIRLMTSTGRPLGSEGFIKELEKVLKRDLFPQKVGRPKKKDKKYGKCPSVSPQSREVNKSAAKLLRIKPPKEFA